MLQNACGLLTNFTRMKSLLNQTGGSGSEKFTQRQIQGLRKAWIIRKRFQRFFKSSRAEIQRSPRFGIRQGSGALMNLKSIIKPCKSYSTNIFLRANLRSPEKKQFKICLRRGLPR